MGHLYGLAFDSAGNLYSANYAYPGVGGSAIEKFTSSGVGTIFAYSGLNNPWGLAFQSIPEPATWVLLAGGLIAMYSVKRRRV